MSTHRMLLLIICSVIFVALLIILGVMLVAADSIRLTLATWMSTAALPAPISTNNILVRNQYLYSVAGGNVNCSNLETNPVVWSRVENDAGSLKPWLYAPNLNAQLLCAAAAAVDHAVPERFYVTGGSKNRDLSAASIEIWRFDIAPTAPERLTRSILTTKLDSGRGFGLLHHAAIIAQGYLWVAGGFNGDPRPIGDPNHGTLFPEIRAAQVLSDGTLGQFSVAGHLRRPLCGQAGAVWNTSDGRTFWYLAGGDWHCRLGSTTPTVTDTIHIVELRPGLTVTVTLSTVSLPRPLAYAGAVVDVPAQGQPRLIIVGGQDRRDALQPYSDVFSIGIADDGQLIGPWITEAPLPQGRSNMGVAIVPRAGKRYLYVAGGQTSRTSVTNDVCYLELNSPPLPPTDPSPAHGSDRQPRHTLLRWQGGDPDGDALQYSVVLTDTLTGATRTLCPNVPLPNCEARDLSVGRRYLWSVRATDAHGASTVGPVWSFKTSSGPNQPTNPSPAEAELVLGKRVELNWSGGHADPGGLPITYTVFLDQYAHPMTERCRVRDRTVCTIEGLAPGQRYYWRVEAEDSTGFRMPPDGQALLVWHFTSAVLAHAPRLSQEVHQPLLNVHPGNAVGTLILQNLGPVPDMLRVRYLGQDDRAHGIGGQLNVPAYAHRVILAGESPNLPGWLGAVSAGGAVSAPGVLIRTLWDMGYGPAHLRTAADAYIPCEPSPDLYFPYAMVKRSGSQIPDRFMRYSVMTLFNPGDRTAHFTVSYNHKGNVQRVADELAAGASRAYNLSDISDPKMPVKQDEWTGGIYVHSQDEPLTGVVTNHWNQFSFQQWTAAYEAATRGSSRIYVPAVSRVDRSTEPNVRSWVRSSQLNIQNVGNRQTMVQIRFYAAGQSVPRLTIERAVMPGEAIACDTRYGCPNPLTDGIKDALGNTFDGSVIIDSVDGQPLAATVHNFFPQYRVTPTGRIEVIENWVVGYLAGGRGATEVYLPYVSRWNCIGAGSSASCEEWTKLYLQNLGTARADVDVAFYRPDGSAPMPSLRIGIPPRSQWSFITSQSAGADGLGDNFVGSVRLTSTQLIQAVVDLYYRKGDLTARGAASYSGILINPAETPTHTPTNTPTNTPTPTHTPTHTPTNTPTNTPTPRPTSTPISTTTRLPPSVLFESEAERGQIVAPMVMARDSAASDGWYVYSPTGHAGTVTFNFNAPIAGQYYVWTRAKGIGWGNNSFFVAIDGVETIDEITPVDGQWIWRWQQADANPFWITAGQHTLRFRAREPYAGLDYVLITGDPDYKPPIIFEAESGTLVAPMTVANDPTASGGSYVHTPPTAYEGSVSFDFKVPVTGNYVIWGRVWGTGWGSDSFWVSVDGGPEALWTIPHDFWQWSRVSHCTDTGCVLRTYQLSADIQHHLRIRTREHGSRLDRIEITRDLSYVSVIPAGQLLLVSQLSLSDIVYDVALAGSYAYVAANDSGLRVINISDAANPREIGRCDTAGHARAVAVQGNYAYVADAPLCFMGR